MNQKKAQAAVEFLATYGWALLVIALVLISLTWLGVFSVQDTIQEYCSFPVGTLECNDVLFVRGSDWGGSTPRENSALEPKILEVTNNFGRDIHICYVFCSQELPEPSTGFIPSLSPLETVACGGNTNSPLLEAGESMNLGEDAWFPPCLGKQGGYISATVGESFSGKIYVFYSYPDEDRNSGYARLVVGDVLTKVHSWVAE